MASANGSVIQGNFLHGLPRPALHGPAVRGVLPLGQRPPIQRMANGSAVQVPVSPGFFGTGMGQRLPETVQRKMESLFGTRFDDVRIHVGPQATSLGALAFTHGSNIYFAHGQYNPQTAQGQRLLGHELTHVVQQRSGRARNPFGSGVAVLQDPALEAEAERMGLRTAAAETVRIPAAPSAVQRKPAVGAAPRPVLQARILPVPPPARRGVLQMVREEDLQALSMLFKAYEWSQKNRVSAGEIQAMYIDSNVVVASNFQGELDSVQALLRKKSGGAIEASGRVMHEAATVVDSKKRFAASYDFLFGTFGSNSVTGSARAAEATSFVETHLTEKVDNLLNGIGTVATASSAAACAGMLSASNTIIFLKSDLQHHAEQQLLEVLAWRLKSGTAPTELGIRGVRKPCSACHRALTAFAAAYHATYGKTLIHLSKGEGTEAMVLDLKRIFPSESGTFGNFVDLYDRTIKPPRTEPVTATPREVREERTTTVRTERQTDRGSTSTSIRQRRRPSHVTEPVTTVRAPERETRQNQGSSWGLGEWLTTGALIGVGATVLYNLPTIVSYASSLLTKEDPSRKRPPLPAFPISRNRPLPP